MLGVSGGLVRQSVKALTQAGYIEVRRRHNADGGQTSNLIRVLFDATPPAEVLRSPTVRTPATSEVTPPVSPELTPPVSSGLTPPVSPGLTLTDPFNDPFNDNPPAPSEPSPPKVGTEDFALPDWIPSEPWTEWMKVRKKKRAANTPFALRRAVKRLSDLKAQGHDPGDVLAQSAFRGYTDLYPIKSSTEQHHEQDPLARRPGESTIEHVQRVNRFHDQREGLHT